MKATWINRNNFPDPFTFRLKKHSDYAKINECYFYDIEADKKEFKNRFKVGHKYLDLLNQKDNIAKNIERTTREICKDLWIETPIYRSSDIPHRKWVGGILDMVRYLGGDTYVNAPGGRSLYSQDMFEDIKLEFIDTVVGPSILCEL
jgi:hypothetical protein